LVKNRNFGQKSKIWPKIENLITNRNFYQKSKFWPKIEILAKKIGTGSLDKKKSGQKKFSEKPNFKPKIFINFVFLLKN